MGVIALDLTLTLRDDSFELMVILAHTYHYIYFLTGILMVIAYPLLLVTAVFFASWMKQVLPKAWFHIHRVLMIISLCCSLLGFMLIFIANKDNPTPGLINLNDCVCILS